MNFINIKNMVSSEIELSKLMMEFIFETRLRLIDKKVNDDEEILSKIVNQMSVFPANPILLDLLSDFLQLIDDENLLETFDLADIEKLLINNKKNQILDLSFTEDLIYWYWNVMDDGKQARDSILEIIPKLEEKLVEFKNLLSDIENDFTD